MSTEVKPILTFNKPKTDGKRGNLNGGGGKPRVPSIYEQAARILPKVTRLEEKFAETIQLSESPAGMTPEKVLVLEVAGDVQSLSDALAKVSGFEVLAQNIIDRDFQDERFYFEKNGKIKPVTKNAYLAMSNQSGLRKLHSMWKRFAESGEIGDGFAPLKHAFSQLSDIRFWSTKDRLETTSLLEDWEYRLEDAAFAEDVEYVSFEIELWYRENSFLRSQAESRLKRIILDCGGKVENVFIHHGISYHAILGSLPVDQVKVVVQSGGNSLELMRCDEVMFFRPLGQCSIPSVDISEQLSDSGNRALSEPPYELQSPSVALLDGLPLSNHEALRGRINIDDPDDFESLYNSPSEQVHGTSMASLIIHGDLSCSNELPLSQNLYVRPILAPGRPQMNGSRVEQVPSNYLPIDLVHRAVMRMKEGDEGLPPSAPNVVVINLSVGDPYRLFDSQMSPWARMLDWLSYKYGVLFVVSAGNMPQSIVLDGVKEAELSVMSDTDVERATIKAISRQKHERRMMSPAEAINALTVKAAHIDSFEGVIPSTQIDVFTTPDMFSPINPITLGKRNSIKPEILMPGGRQTYVNRTYMPTHDVELRPSNSASFGPGIKTALPSSTPGSINSYGFTAGTSNAAAIATRRLALLSETVMNINELGDEKALSHAPEAVLLKALLAHGAEHTDHVTTAINKYLKNKNNSRTFKSDLNQYLGFGLVDEARIHACKSNQATLIYTGRIKDGAAHEYHLPLPPCLAAETVERRLIVTVAWFAPVNHGHQDYRGAQLWATPAHQTINASSNDYYHHHLKNGTIFHEVRRGDKAAAFTEGDKLAVQVHCNARAGFDGIEVPYAIVVSLDTPGVNLPIYEEVKQGLSIDVEQTA